MNSSPEINRHLLSSIEVKRALLSEEYIDKIQMFINMQVSVLSAGNKLIFAGNGGSAADAQHLATEYVSKLRDDRPAMAAISLATDTSVLTAVGNDYGFENLFTRQLEAVGCKGDLFIAISTSGNSGNLNRALSYCAKFGINTMALLGNTGGEAQALCENVLVVPSQNTAHIQEAHITIGHIVCSEVERHFFFNEKS